MASEVNDVQSGIKNVNMEDDDDVVDPWNVTSKSETGVDYDKLISE